MRTGLLKLFVLMLAASLVATACGQKGPLVLPDAKARTKSTTARPAPPTQPAKPAPPAPAQP